MTGHTTERFQGNGIELNVHRFEGDDPATASCEGQGITVLLLHGFLDAGGTWDWVGHKLAQRGFEVRAIDFRGFGDSDRVPTGGYYHFPDYVADLDALLAQLQPQRLLLVGHSMGGTVASLFSGARPERVHKLVLLEGLGPPAMDAAATRERTRSWLQQLAAPRKTTKLASPADALQRLCRAHPRIPREVLETRVAHLTAGSGDELRWKYDPLHRTTAPVAFQVESFRHFLAAIGCPVLFVGGGSSGWHPQDEAERLEAIGGPVEHVELEGAGHMLHWTQPDRVAEHIARFALA